MICASVVLLILLIDVTGGHNGAEDTASLPLLHCRYQVPVLQTTSSGVHLLATELAQRVINPLVAPQALRTGTGLSFKNFFAGGSDLALCSRQLLPGDYSASDCDPTLVTPGGTATGRCQDRLPHGVKVGYDGLVVVASKLADWLPAEGFTTDQLRRLLLGKEAALDVLQLPADGLNVTLWSTDDGLSLYQSADVMGEDLDEGYGHSTLEGVQGILHDQEVIEMVAASPHALGIVSLPYLQAAGDRVRVVAVNGFVPLLNAAPDDALRAYPLLRPLYVFYDASAQAAADPAGRSTHAIELACSLLSESGQRLVARKGYVPLDRQEQVEESDMLGCETQAAVQIDYVPLSGSMQQMSYCRSVKEVTIMGSSTVYPIAFALGAVFPNTLLRLVTRSVGSGIGLENLLAGAVEIASSSRTMRPSDYADLGCNGELVRANGTVAGYCHNVLPGVVQVGRDEMSVVVSRNGSCLSDSRGLSLSQLRELFGERKVLRQVLPDCPAIVPNLYVPDINSGSRAFFEEKVVEVDASVYGYSDDSLLVASLSTDPKGLGFVGMSHVNTKQVTAVPLDGILPFGPTADPDNYPLSRPLFLYYNANPATFRRETQELLCFALSEVGQRMVEFSGYLPLDRKDVERQQEELHCS